MKLHCLVVCREQQPLTLKCCGTLGLKNRRSDRHWVRSGWGTCGNSLYSYMKAIPHTLLKKRQGVWTDGPSTTVSSFVFRGLGQWSYFKMTTYQSAVAGGQAARMPRTRGGDSWCARLRACRHAYSHLLAWLLALFHPAWQHFLQRAPFSPIKVALADRATCMYGIPLP